MTYGELIENKKAEQRKADKIRASIFEEMKKAEQREELFKRIAARNAREYGRN